MVRTKRLMRVGAMAWLGGVALLALHLTSNASTVRLLAASEMRDAARGGLPAPCTHLLINTTCQDYGAGPGVNNPGQVPCKYKNNPNICQRRCNSCSNLNAPHQYYTNKFGPWNAYACAPGAVPGGCGKRITGAKCQWIASQQICICTGGQVIDEPCDQGTPKCLFDCQ